MVSTNTSATKRCERERERKRKCEARWNLKKTGFCALFQLNCRSSTSFLYVVVMLPRLWLLWLFVCAHCVEIISSALDRFVQFFCFAYLYNKWCYRFWFLTFSFSTTITLHLLDYCSFLWFGFSVIFRNHVQKSTTERKKKNEKKKHFCCWDVLTTTLKMELLCMYMNTSSNYLWVIFCFSWIFLNDRESIDNRSYGC